MDAVGFFPARNLHAVAIRGPSLVTSELAKWEEEEGGVRERGERVRQNDKVSQRDREREQPLGLISGLSDVRCTCQFY